MLACEHVIRIFMQVAKVYLHAGEQLGYSNFIEIYIVQERRLWGPLVSSSES
jgi:hypothetical protein